MSVYAAVVRQLEAAGKSDEPLGAMALSLAFAVDAAEPGGLPSLARELRLTLAELFRADGAKIDDGIGRLLASLSEPVDAAPPKRKGRAAKS